VPLHNVCAATVSTVGVGFTVMVNVSGVPVQPLAEGVTVMVAVIIVVPMFVAVNEAMSPFPVAANPIEGVLFVQPNEVPDTVSPKLMTAVGAPLHNICAATVSTVGVGLTVMVNVSPVPVQPFAEGVTVMVAVTAVLPVLVAVKDAMLPFPAAASPMEGVSLVQSKDVPATVSANVTAAVDAPLHSVCGVPAGTVGVGLTVMVNVSAVPVQPFAEGVTVMVAVTVVFPVLVAVKDAMLPFPAAASPMEGVSLVQSKDVPATVSANVTAAVDAPLHSVCGVPAGTVGVGLTVMVKLRGTPKQLLAEGVTVIFAVMAAFVALVAV